MGELKQLKLPMTYYVSPGQPLEGKDAASLAAILWNEAVGREIIKVKIEIAPSRERNNIYFSNNQRIDFTKDRLGTTAIASGLPPRTIAEADIYIPDFTRTFSLIETCYNRNEVEKFDLLSVMTHEMGHGLGLPHYNFKNSIMSATTDMTFFDMIASGKDITEFAKPTKFDINKIKGKYPEYFNDDNK